MIKKFEMCINCMGNQESNAIKNCRKVTENKMGLVLVWGIYFNSF